MDIKGKREKVEGTGVRKYAESTIRLWWDHSNHLSCQAHKVKDVGPLHAWRFHREGHFYWPHPLTESFMDL